MLMGLEMYNKIRVKMLLCIISWDEENLNSKQFELLVHNWLNKHLLNVMYIVYVVHRDS